MKKLFISIPEQFKNEYNSIRIKENWFALFMIGISVLVIQLFVILIGFRIPFTADTDIWFKYRMMYLVFATLNAVFLILLILTRNKLRNKVGIKVLIMCIHMFVLHIWSMGVAVADQFQNEDIVVYYIIMIFFAIFMNIPVHEFLVLLLVVFSGFVLVIFRNASLFENHQSLIWTSAQFIFFTLLIRYYIDELKKKNLIQNFELQSLNEELEYYSYHDPLTGLLNRRKFEEVYKDSYDKAVIYQNHLGILLLDIDYFKQYNDTYGHVEGDKVLRLFGDLLKEVFKDDLCYICRYGGDEFIICTRELPRQKVEARIQEIYASMKLLNIPNTGSKIEPLVTVSIGMNHAVPMDEEGGWNFVVEADRLLYMEKANRQNKNIS